MKRLPIIRACGERVGWTLVDDEDAERFGRFTWRPQAFGYAVRWGKTRRPNPKTVALALHREIMGLRPGDGLEVDHINGDKLDNRRANLRVCTRAENGQNIGKFKANASSRFRGVYRHNGKWRAVARLNGARHELGYYDDELDAARAAEAFRRKHMPFAHPDPALAVKQEAAA